MQFERKPFSSKRRNPVRLFFARLSHEFKMARGPMKTPLQRIFGVLETLFIDHTFISLMNPNKHKITETFWRSSQPTALQIAQMKKDGIASIINLRGERDCASYYIERDACAKAGIRLINFPVNSRQPPKREIIEKMEELFASAPTPALMHCKAGADRVGLMSALYLIIHEKRPVEEAMEQLSGRFGHIREAKAGVLDKFLEAYRDFNARQPTPFLEWAMKHYDRDAIIASHRPAEWAEIIYNKILRRE